MRALSAAVLFCFGSLLALGAGASDQDYAVLKKAALGGDGGWDYLKVDAEARRLYISRATHVMVVDADTLRPVGDIPDTPGVHGIAIARDLGRGFTSNGRDDSVSIFELGTLKALGRVKTGSNPDAILYDDFSHRVFAMNGHSGDVTVIDAGAGRVAGTIPVGGKLEFAVSDGAGRIFVNVEDKNEIVALDANDMTVTARWPLAECEEPSGLAIDVAHRRLFAVCGNRQMAVIDADNGRQVATLPIGDGPDGAGFDAERQLAFSSNGDGTLTVVHEISPEKFEAVQQLATQPSARTMTLDARTHNVFLIAAEFGERPAPTAEQPTPRAPVLPGSFTVLLVGRALPLAGEERGTPPPAKANDDRRRTLARFVPNFGRDALGVFSRDSLKPLLIGAGVAGVGALFDDNAQRYFSERRRAKWLGDAGEQLGRANVIAPEALALLVIGRLNHHQSFRDASYDVAEVTLVSAGYTTLLKSLTHRERPDGSNKLSFPSGHASNAFAWATIGQHYYGWRLGLPGYFVASAIAVSRMEKNVHHLSDVLAGAGIGYLTARSVMRKNSEPLSTARATGLSFSPIQDPHGHGAGLQAALAF